MIRHIVMWKLLGDQSARRRNALSMKEKLEGLMGVIPQLKSARVKLCCNPSPDCYDAVFIAEFETLADLAIYQAHPAHMEISAFCKSVRESRAALDYEI